MANNVPNPPVDVGDQIYVSIGDSRNCHKWWSVGQCEGLKMPEVYDLKLIVHSLGLIEMRPDLFTLEVQY